MPSNRNRIEQRERTMVEIGVFLRDPDLGQLDLSVKVLEMQSTVAKQLTSLRTTRAALESLEKRDTLGREPSLAHERITYQNQAATVETFFDFELMPTISQLHKTLKGNPDWITLANDLGRILDLAQELGEGAARAVDPTKLSTEAPAAFSQGLNALIELMQAPKVRAAVVRFQTDFQASSDQINVVSDYKRLHDLLHQLQFHCYNPIVQEVKRFPNDETARDNLDDHQLTLQRVVDDLRDVVVRASFATNETLWIDDLNQAQKELHGAIENSDMKQLKKAAWRINRVLTVQPSQINTRLNDAARALRLPALVNAMTFVRDNLGRPDLDPKKVHQFEAGVDALASLNHGLSTLINDHDKWQAVDCELRRIEANLEQDIGELEWSWPDFKANTVPLYSGSMEEWAKTLKADGEKLETAIAAQDPMKVKQYFRSYHRRASHRFYRVDMTLKRLCEDFLKVGEPLASVLRVIE